MKEGFIYSQTTGECVSYTRKVTNEQYSIFDFKTNNSIGYIVMNNGLAHVYDNSNNYIEYGVYRSNPDMILFYNQSTSECVKYMKL